MINSSRVRRISQINCRREVDGYGSTGIVERIVAERLGQGTAVHLFYTTQRVVGIGDSIDPAVDLLVIIAAKFRGRTTTVFPILLDVDNAPAGIIGGKKDPWG